MARRSLIATKSSYHVITQTIAELDFPRSRSLKAPCQTGRPGSIQALHHIPLQRWAATARLFTRLSLRPCTLSGLRPLHPHLVHPATSITANLPLRLSKLVPAALPWLFSSPLRPSSSDAIRVVLLKHRDLPDRLHKTPPPCLSGSATLAPAWQITQDPAPLVPTSKSYKQRYVSLFLIVGSDTFRCGY